MTCEKRAGELVVGDVLLGNGATVVAVVVHSDATVTVGYVFEDGFTRHDRVGVDMPSPTWVGDRP